MFLKLFIPMIVIVAIKCSSPSRRIAGGKRVLAEKRYMAYLLKSNMSNRLLYDSWLCGGAIVSPRHILTSAACLADVTHLYAIAGYNKYVRSENLDLDECTRERKQKVIKTCVPIKYKIDYQNVYNWAFMDLGFAIVEKPYDFSDVTYRRHCSYVPAPISINFDPKYEEDDTDAFVYGWGHNHALRLPGDYQDYNQEFLQETTTRIVSRSYCEEYYKNLTRTFDNYVICCTGQGYIDRDGNMEGPQSTNENGCYDRRKYSKGCGDILYYDYGFDSRRNENNTTPRNKTDSKDNGARRQGVICQNDHGGPLVTWVGSEEYVVGVAITSLYSDKYECIGPQLFSSTICTSMFIKCVLNYPGFKPNRRMCENMGKEVGYEIQETEIDWNNIDENPENEKLTDKNISSTDNDGIFKLNQSNTENNQNNAKNNVEKGNTRTNEETQNKQQQNNQWPFLTTDQLDFDAVDDDVVVI